MQQTDINDFTQRLLPLTVFRRNAGMVLEKLKGSGELIITKDGKPIARLSSLETEDTNENTEKKLTRLRKLAGGLRFKKQLSPQDINRKLDKRHEKMLP